MSEVDPFFHFHQPELDVASADQPTTLDVTFKQILIVVDCRANKENSELCKYRINKYY